MKWTQMRDCSALFGFLCLYTTLTSQLYLFLFSDRFGDADLFDFGYLCAYGILPWSVLVYCCLENHGCIPFFSSCVIVRAIFHLFGKILQNGPACGAMRALPFLFPLIVIHSEWSCVMLYYFGNRLSGTVGNMMKISSQSLPCVFLLETFRVHIVSLSFWTISLLSKPTSDQRTRRRTQIKIDTLLLSISTLCGLE